MIQVIRTQNDCQHCGAKKAQITAVTRNEEQILLVIPHTCGYCGRSPSVKHFVPAEAKDN